MTCKPSSHKTVAEYIRGAELQEHRQTTVTRGKRTTTIYRWLSAVPLRDTKDALAVNWFPAEILNGKGKRTYYNSFITDLEVTAATVAGLAARGNELAGVMLRLHREPRVVRLYVSIAQPGVSRVHIRDLRQRQLVHKTIPRGAEHSLGPAARFRRVDRDMFNA